MHLARRSARHIPIAFVLGPGRLALWPQRSLAGTKNKTSTKSAAVAGWCANVQQPSGPEALYKKNVLN